MALISTKCWHQLVQTALLRFANTAMRINQHANRKRMEATSYRVNALVLYCSHQDCSETKPSNSRAPFLGFRTKKKQTHLSLRQVLKVHNPPLTKDTRSTDALRCQFHSPISGAVTVKSFPEETTFIPPFPFQQNFVAAAAKKKIRKVKRKKKKSSRVI